MKQKFLAFALLIFAQLHLIGQQLYELSVEELKDIMDTTSVNLQFKVDVGNEIAYKLRDSQTDQAKIYANKSMGISYSISYGLGKSFSLVILGLIAKREKDVNLAEIYFLEALSIRKKLTSKKDIASVYNNLGLLFERNNSIKANGYYEQGLVILKELPTSSFKAVVHNNYGNFLTQEKRFDEAFVQLDFAIGIRRRKGNLRALANSYLNLSSLYFEINDTSQFKIFIDSSQMIFNSLNDQLGLAKSYNLLGSYHVANRSYEDARKYFALAMSLSGNNLNNQYKYLRNLGALEIHLENYKKALEINEKCLAYFDTIEDQRESAAILINIGTIYYEQSNFREAITNYEKSLERLDNINDIGLEAKALLFLSASYGHIGENEKSADIGVHYLQLSDLYNQQKSNNLNSLLDKKDIIFQNAELKLKEVTSELTIKKERLEKMRVYLILGGGIIIILFLLAAGVAFIYRQKKQIADLKIDELLSKYERSTNYARLEEQESVRNRIARDLHDRLGSLFTVIKFSLGDIESALSNIKEETKTHYYKVNELIDEACDEVRNIAHDLRNSTLANFGLKIAMESLVESLNTSNIDIILQTHELDTRLNNKIEVNVYLIIQELISNVLKHSKASKLIIQLNLFEHLLNITMEDNGVGFDLKKVKMGMGIKNIETRVHELDGQLNIDSGRGNGTTVVIDIPLNS